MEARVEQEMEREIDRIGLRIEGVVRSQQLTKIEKDKLYSEFLHIARDSYLAGIQILYKSVRGEA